MAITIPTADPRESGSAFMPELRSALSLINTGSFLTDNAAWTVSDVLAGEAAGKHLSFGYDASGSTAYIRSVNSATAFTDLYLAGLKTSFWSASGTGDVVETLTATAGKVGIGLNPVAKLDVAGDIYLTKGSSPLLATGDNQILRLGVNVSESMRIDTASNVGIGTSTVSARLHSMSATEQLRLGYDASKYASFTVGSGGLLTVTPIGGQTLRSDSSGNASVLSLTTATVGVSDQYGLIETSSNGGFWAQNHDTIFKVPGRLFVGGATESDGAYPPVAKDWLLSLNDVSWNGGAGVSQSGLLAQSVFLTGAISDQSQIALLAGARSTLQTSAGPNIYAFGAVCVNDNATHGNPGWAIYSEAHRKASHNGQTTVFEAVIRNSGNSVVSDPYLNFVSGMTSTMVLGSGNINGSTIGTTNNTAGIVLLGGYNQTDLSLPSQAFNTGILFWDGSIAGTGPGTTGAGTVTNSAGGTTVTGTGTTFLTFFSVGQPIKIGTEIRSISAIASDTSLTVALAFPSAHTASAYSRGTFAAVQLAKEYELQWFSAASTLSCQIRGTDAGLILQPTDNHVGIGTTDIKTWDAGQVALRVGASASLMADRTAGGFSLSSNAYYEGGGRGSALDWEPETQQIIFRLTVRTTGGSQMWERRIHS